MADYVLEGPKWASRNITWSFATSNISGQAAYAPITQTFQSYSTVFQNDVISAFQKWSQAANLVFTQVTDSANADIRLAWTGIDGPSNVAGITQYQYSGSNFLSDNVIEFDTGDIWVLGSDGEYHSGNASGTSFIAVALHEIGHALGLGHYNADLAIMNSVSSPSITNLTQHDINGIQALYGAPVTSVATTQARVASDFNGDGASDILWRNSSTGNVGVWRMSNNAPAWVSIGVGASPWGIVGTGDFNADGTTDILWRNSSTGDVGEWQMHNNTPTWIGIGTGASPWSVVGTGDFNGDGVSDILWRNTSTGAVGVWTMKNNQPTWTGIGTGATSWSVVGTGDFNGDGTTDILWRDASTGAVGEWQMNNNAPTWIGLGTGASPWSIVGTGDFNGDGISDILWQNSTTGAVGEWQMRNNAATWVGIGTGSSPWSVAATGDYNHDGTTDILWSNSSSGAVGEWLMTNNVATWAQIGTGASSWQINAT